MSNPSPILFVDHAAAMGGAERSLLLILQHLDRKMWTPYLVCSGDQLGSVAESLDVGIYQLKFPRLRGNLNIIQWFRSIWELKSVIADTKPEFIICNTVRAVLYGMFASWLTKVPNIWYMRDFWVSETEPRYIWFDSFLKMLISKSARFVITNSHATAGGLPTSKNIRVIHNGIDLTKFTPQLSGDIVRDRLNIDRDQLVIGMVGRLRPWKGQDRFIRLASQILEQHPDVICLIVGGDIFGVKDQYREYLESLVLDLKLHDRVFFTGHLEDVRPALAAMDIFIHPGDPEPFGLVNVEAMAMGKPVASFAHGALPEIVEDGITGFLVPPYDENGLANAVISLLKNPSQRKQMGLAGRVRAEEHFSVQRMLTEIEGVFSDVIEELG